ncbi:MAG: hypothetical protein WD872_07400 [Pirellulaceae bacterium]
MEARLSRAALIVAALLSLGANYPQPASCRSEHFIVTAPSEDLAREICQAAEQFRKELAIEWLGHELPAWRGVCPIAAKVHPQLGAGGATSFTFDHGGPHSWTMNIQGSRERILDSVLPHEITHTIFATHFGRALPRWADEGACTTVEHAAEKAKQDRFLIEFLHTERGIPFNQMFAMKEYPEDILPLYSQGYSLTRFLLHQGGKRKFIEYVGEGMQSNNWTAATRAHYGFASLSNLQVTWLDWVRKGSPDLQASAAEGLAAAPAPPAQEQPEPTTLAAIALARQNSAYGWQTPPAQNARTFAQAEDNVQPVAPSHFTAASAAPISPATSASNVSRPVSGGWYTRQRDRAQSGLQPSPVDARQAAEPLTPAAHLAPADPVRTPAPAAGDRRILMEWRRDNGASQSERNPIDGLALQQSLQHR